MNDTVIMARPTGHPLAGQQMTGAQMLVQVLAVRGTALKTGRVRWWHRLLWRLSALPRAAGWLVRRGLCAAARHRVTRESFGLRHCWCRRRWEDGADWDDEDGCE